MNKQPCIIVSAPSGAGKTTLVQFLLTCWPQKLAFSVSATTRKPRGEERNGVDYYFMSEEAFKNKIKCNEFIEFEEVYSGVLYGTLLENLKLLWQQDKIPVFDVDVRGALKLKSIFKNQCVSIFIAPPHPEILKNRLENRNTDSPESIQKRLTKATEELKRAPEFDVMIVNDNLEQACMQIQEAVAQFLKQFD